MKKLIAISILLTVLSAAAFAQFTASLNADFYPSLFVATAPLDDAKDKDISKDRKGSDPYAGTGTFDLFTSGSSFKANELRFSLRYNDPDGNYSGYVRFRGDGLFNPAGGGNTFTNAGSGTANNAGGVRFQDFLNLSIDEFEIKGKAGMLDGKVSAVADRGKVNSFASNGFHNFMDGVKIDHFGVLLPNTTTGFKYGFTTQEDDVNNLRRTAVVPDGSGAAGAAYDTTYMAVGVTFPNNIPLYVQFAGDAKPMTGQSASYSKSGAAFRVSGVKIADMVNFDVIYKIKGMDPNTDNNRNYQPDGLGIWQNAVGVYANASLMDNKLGLGIGYSGLFKVQENGDKESTGAGYDSKEGEWVTIKYSHPFFSGIDLRAQYSGIENIRITTNHNFSFTGTVNGSENADKVIISPTGQQLGKDTSESYFAMYNSLGVDYSLSKQLVASLQIGNRFMTNTFKYKNSDDDSITEDYLYDRFRTVAMAEYKMGKVTFAGGLAFDIQHSTNKETDRKDKNGDADSTWKAGTFTFGVPLRFRVEF